MCGDFGMHSMLSEAINVVHRFTLGRGASDSSFKGRTNDKWLGRRLLCLTYIWFPLLLLVVIGPDRRTFYFL